MMTFDGEHNGTEGDQDTGMPAAPEAPTETEEMPAAPAEGGDADTSTEGTV